MGFRWRGDDWAARIGWEAAATWASPDGEPSNSAGCPSARVVGRRRETWRRCRSTASTGDGDPHRPRAAAEKLGDVCRGEAGPDSARSAIWTSSARFPPWARKDVAALEGGDLQPHWLRASPTTNGVPHREGTRSDQREAGFWSAVCGRSKRSCVVLCWVAPKMARSANLACFTNRAAAGSVPPEPGIWCAACARGGTVSSVST